ncbi:MAG: 30S ribosomal protein S12 methylthiotransferase RimO, partial [Candidatus Woesearchaeota archaeon]
KFIKDYKLDNVGFFKYSKEEFTKAAKLKKQVPEFIKNYRLRKIQKIQDKILLEKQQNKKNSTVNVLCDSTIHNTIQDTVQNTGNTLYIGRTEYNAPNIDPKIIFSSKEKLETGKFYNIRLNEIKNYDFKGEKL